METFVAPKSPRKVTVTCAHCGDSDDINDRSRRRKLAEGKPHYCSVCRAVQAIKVRDEDRAYWTTRFSQQEIDAMVGSLI